VNSIDIEGNGGDDTITNLPDPYAAPYLRAFTSLNIAGGDGNDMITPDGIDTINSDGGVDASTQVTVDGGNGDDTVTGGLDAPLTINGDAGNDNLSGGTLNDTIHGDDGNDTIDGRYGNDTIFGDAGNDTITGGAGNDTIDGGTGTDNLCGDCTGFDDGNDTINAVDGEADQVACGLGADVANVDQYDTVDTNPVTGCETVNRTPVGTCPAGQTGTPPNCQTPPLGGDATARPKVVAFASHCVRRHGHRVCTAPVALKNHTYSGKTGQHRPVSVSVDKKGRYAAFKFHEFRLTCADGSVWSDNAEDAFSDHQRISGKGTFNTQLNYAPAQGWTHETYYVVGAFDGHHAKGTVVGNAQITGHGECTSGDVSWTAGP
jgi:hypothetical protein